MYINIPALRLEYHIYLVLLPNCIRFLRNIAFVTFAFHKATSKIDLKLNTTTCIYNG